MALTGWPLTFLVDLSWEGVDSVPLLVSTLYKLIKNSLLFS